jgi:hypothetical protein
LIATLANGATQAHYGKILFVKKSVQSIITTTESSSRQLSSSLKTGQEFITTRTCQPGRSLRGSTSAETSSPPPVELSGSAKLQTAVPTYSISNLPSSSKFTLVSACTTSVTTLAARCLAGKILSGIMPEFQLILIGQCSTMRPNGKALTLLRPESACH